jgi:UPF0271 protein
MTIDINCDLGESFGIYKIGNDELVMPYVTSANIACGFHAGDPQTIMKTIISAIKNGVSIGAHPGYHDLEGFGRRPMKLSHEELRSSIIYQVGAVKCMTEVSGGKLRHVKPHGALYNAASVDFDLAMVIALAVKDIDSSLILFGMAGSEVENAARIAGIAWASEFFADRAYNDDGSLVSRNIPGAVLHNTIQVVDRTVKMIKERVVETITGRTIPVQADTICIHGDGEMVSEYVKSLTVRFSEEGIRLSPVSKK